MIIADNSVGGFVDTLKRGGRWLVDKAEDVASAGQDFIPGGKAIAKGLKIAEGAVGAGKKRKPQRKTAPRPGQKTKGSAAGYTKLQRARLAELRRRRAAEQEAARLRQQMAEIPPKSNIVPKLLIAAGVAAAIYAATR